MDLCRRLLNAPEIVAATLILRRAFTPQELGAVHGVLRERARKSRYAKRVEREGNLLGCIEQPGAFRLRLRVDSSPLFVLELANADRALAWWAVVRNVLTDEELVRLEKLLRYQLPSSGLQNLTTAVELQLAKRGHQ